MLEKMKNIILVQVVIILILSGAVLTKNHLVEKMTEYNADYQIVVKK